MWWVDWLLRSLSMQIWYEPFLLLFVECEIISRSGVNSLESFLQSCPMRFIIRKFQLLDVVEKPSQTSWYILCWSSLGFMYRNRIMLQVMNSYFLEFWHSILRMSSSKECKDVTKPCACVHWFCRLFFPFFIWVYFMAVINIELRAKSTKEAMSSMIRWIYIYIFWGLKRRR
jgi:hypothetical protein